MMLNLDGNLDNILFEEMDIIERNDLDSMDPDKEKLEKHLLNNLNQNLGFCRIKGINFIGDMENFQKTSVQNIRNFVVSSCELDDLSYMCTSRAGEMGIFISAGSYNNTLSHLKNSFPGIQVYGKAPHNLGNDIVSRIGNLGMLSGLPTIPDFKDNSQESSIAVNRIVSGMGITDWLYYLNCYKQTKQRLISRRKDLLEKISYYNSLIKAEYQESIQTSDAVSSTQNQSNSRMVSGELSNYRAQFLVDCLLKELERVNFALSVGGWQSQIIFGATTKNDAIKLKNLLLGLFSGEKSFPDRMRGHLCDVNGESVLSHFHTYHNSYEVSTLMALPDQEVQGFFLHKDYNFSVDYHQSSGASQHKLGKIMNQNLVLDKGYFIDIDILTRHCAVLGITGSGKTTTIKNLLVSLSNSDIPFLVIEPTKNEYRHLLVSRTKEYFPRLRVYTLGQEDISPFRFNPFEFEMIGVYRTSVLSHIEFLKAVFNSAFILYAPMPYILDIALHEIYEDKGWILSSCENLRVENEKEYEDFVSRLFPTFSDLYSKIESVTKRFGYEQKIEQNVIASLRARIDSLRSGSAGVMMDVSHGMTMKKIFKAPTILELQEIGNDEEKSFIIGILFVRLFEYLRLSTQTGIDEKKLKHLTIIEEAHRLLKNINTEINTETENLRANSVETFNNMLSEIRHYGEGLLIADQIPNKLSPDVIKNTNLKIVHRLLAEDDRLFVAGSMNISKQESMSFANLQQGQAIIFSEANNYPYKIAVKDVINISEEALTNSELKSIALKKLDLHTYFPISDFTNFGITNEHYNHPSQKYLRLSKMSWDNNEFRRLCSQLCFSTLFLSENSDKNIYQKLSHKVLTLVPTKIVSEKLTNFVTLMGINRVLEQRGQDRWMSFDIVEEFQKQLLSYVYSIRCGTPDSSLKNLLQRKYFSELQHETGFFPGCSSCNHRCHYLLDVKDMIRPKDINYLLSLLSVVTNDIQDQIELVKDELCSLLSNYTLSENITFYSEIIYCMGLFTFSHSDLSDMQNLMFANRLSILVDN